MNLTIWTFLSIFHFVLARSAFVTAIALPPVMAAFPFIPVIAYTLIISAFSYVSVRVLKHKFSYDLLALLRRKGRLMPLPTLTNSEHELLPVATVSRPPTPSIGVYAESSNVSVRRNASFGALPSPPRLISPASSPPPPAQIRPGRATNHALASFPVLEPTVYIHKPRRSRSLGIPIPRPRNWSSRISSLSQELIEDSSTKDGDDIPLSLLSKNAHLAQPSSMHLCHPELNAPLMSAPIFPTSASRLPSKPLFDVCLSPSISPSSSGSHDSLRPVLSSSSSELAPCDLSSPSGSDSDGPLGISQSPRRSDIGVRTGGVASGYAYDWGIEDFHEFSQQANEAQCVSRTPELSSEFSGRRFGFDSPTSQPEDLSPGISHLESEAADGMERKVHEPLEGSLFSLEAPRAVSEDDGLTVPGKTALQQDDEDDTIISPLTPSSETLTLITRVVEDGLVSLGDTESEGEYVAKTTVCDLEEAQRSSTKMCTILRNDSESLLSLPPPLHVEEVNIGERPSVSIDTSPVSRGNSLLSANKGECLSPLSPSQTPTPPASPPLAPIPIARLFADCGLAMDTYLTKSESISPVEMKGVTEETGREDNYVPDDVPNSRDADLNVTRADVQHIENNPSVDPAASIPPAWSVRAKEAPPLDLVVAPAVTTEGDVEWLRTPTADETETKNEEIIDEESVDQPELGANNDTNAEQTRDVPISGRATITESKSSLPGSFPEPELKSAQKNLVTVSASSTSVSPVVVATGVGRRRNAARGLPIDVALAMQMRPGLGMGADPAWMVRFLMAVFGWLTIMIAGRGGDVDVYAL